MYFILRGIWITLEEPYINYPANCHHKLHSSVDIRVFRLIMARILGSVAYFIAVANAAAYGAVNQTAPVCQQAVCFFKSLYFLSIF